MGKKALAVDFSNNSNSDDDNNNPLYNSYRRLRYRCRDNFVFLSPILLLLLLLLLLLFICWTFAACRRNDVMGFNFEEGGIALLGMLLWLFILFVAVDVDVEESSFVFDCTNVDMDRVVHCYIHVLPFSF